MWIVLCDPGDRSALWAATGLRSRRLSPVEVITPAELVYGPRNEYRIRNGVGDLQVTLGDGRKVDSSRVRGVLNRMTVVPSQHLRHARQADRAYALEEWSALVVSWLASMTNVINSPHPLGLCGQTRHPSEWAKLAGEAGLDSRYIHGRLTGPTTEHSAVVVLDDAAFGPATTGDIGAACVRLASLAGTRLLGLWLSGRDGPAMTLVAATPLPDLRVGGESLLDELAERLSVRSRAA